MTILLDSVQYVVKTIYRYLRWAFLDLKRYFSGKIKTKEQIRNRLQDIDGSLGQSLFFARAHASDARDRGDYKHYEEWLEEVVSAEGEFKALKWVLGNNDPAVKEINNRQ